jgi:hypothetical protein
MLKKLFDNVKAFKYDYFLLLGALLVFYIFANTINYNADTLFPFRYSEAILSSEPFKILVQPGPRFFPDVFYAAVIRLFTNNPVLHFYLTILLNAIILAIATYIFFYSIYKNKPISIKLSGLFILLFPTSYIYFKSIVSYITLLPGTHGFTATLSLFCVSFILQILNKKKTSFISYFIFATLVIILGINNQLIIAMFIAPILGTFFVLKLICRKRFKLKPFAPVIFILVFTAIISLFSQYIWALFSNLEIRSMNSRYLNVSLLSWLNGSGQNLFNKIANFNATGIFLILLVASIVVSVLIVFQNVFSKNLKKIDFISLFLNTLNVMFVLVLIGAQWTINSDTFRYMPHVYMFSTLIIMFNAVQYGYYLRPQITNKITGIFINLLLIINVINLTANPNNYDFEHTSQYDFLFSHIKQLKSNKLISDTGLSSYWIANSETSQYELNILPLTAHARPNIFAINAMTFWQDNQQNRNFTFVANYLAGTEHNWAINKKTLFKRFGRPTKTIALTDERNKKYEIYLYPKFKSKPIYKQLNKLIQKHFTQPQ